MFVECISNFNLGFNVLKVTIHFMLFYVTLHHVHYVILCYTTLFTFVHVIYMKFLLDSCLCKFPNSYVIILCIGDIKLPTKSTEFLYKNHLLNNPT